MLAILPAKYPTTMANTKHRTMVGGDSMMIYRRTGLNPEQQAGKRLT